MILNLRTKFFLRLPLLIFMVVWPFETDLVNAVTQLNHQEPVISMLRDKPIHAAAHLNSETKEINGVKYHLLSIYFNPLVHLHVRDGSYCVWLINGKRIHAATKENVQTLEQNDRFTGQGVLTLWVHFDSAKELEILYGVVNLEETGKAVVDNPTLLRKELLKKFVPLSVKKLPTQDASNLAQLLDGLKKIGQNRMKETVYSAVRLNGRTMQQDGKLYYLVAIHHDPYLVIDIGGNFGSELSIQGDKGCRKFRDASQQLKMAVSYTHLTLPTICSV